MANYNDPINIDDEVNRIKQLYFFAANTV